MIIGELCKKEFEILFVKSKTRDRISKDTELQREVPSGYLEDIIDEQVRSYEDFFNKQRFSRGDPMPRGYKR